MITKTTGYHVGQLIDGSGNPAIENRIVCVADGRIQQIVERSQAVDPEMEIVDLSDCTVFPALIDAHVHLVMSGTTQAAHRKNQLNSGYGERKRIIAEHVRQHLECGVLGVRDGGDNRGDTLRYKVETTGSCDSGVTIASAGRGRNARGRYGKLIAIPVEEGITLAQSAFDAGTPRDHLKIVNSGLNSLTQFGVETPPQFEKEELAAAITEAKRRGQPSMVHANGRTPVKFAIDAGCDSIEHGFFMGEENMRRMADAGVTWVPTAVTMKAYINYLKRQGHRSDASFGEISGRNLEHQLAQIDAAKRLGVTIALGTDAGSPGVHHGLSVKEELGAFRRRRTAC
jgi:imidazolonepropionase-like amidohydrolase